LEPLIESLDFELKNLPVWKIPRIWFYADSVEHIRTLADAVNRLVWFKHAGCWLDGASCRRIPTLPIPKRYSG
jgi:hypothetical protein